MAAHLVSGDLFESDLPWPEERQYALVILMPGRLLEAGPHRSVKLRQWLKERCERLLIYAYDDWLTQHGTLRIGWTIRLLQENGTTLGEPHCKHMDGGLWELRTQVEGDAFRCLYVSWTGERFLILHAFQKKTPKTPPREIDLARRRWADWLARDKEPG